MICRKFPDQSIAVYNSYAVVLCRSLSQSFAVYILLNKSQPCSWGDLRWRCKCCKANLILICKLKVLAFVLLFAEWLCCKVEIRLVCHLRASHPAVPSSTELFLFWVCPCSRWSLSAQSHSSWLGAGRSPQAQFNFVRNLKGHAAHHLVFNYFFPQICQAPSLKQANFFAHGKQSPRVWMS